METRPNQQVHPAQVAPAPPLPLRVRSHGLTDRGRVRDQNEDQFLIAELAKAMQITGTSIPQPRTVFSDARAHLFAVADGMGGHRAGAQASALAVTSIERYVLESLQWFGDLSAGDQALLRDFRAALVEADATLFAVSAERPEFTGMGSTLTVAWCQNDELLVLHAGDSRCYLARSGQLYRLTEDHTLVNELVRGGAIRAEDASEHTMRHVVTNAVGGHQPGVKAEVRRARLAPGDALLLCSDGLTGMVDDRVILAVLSAERDPARACERLMSSALEAGGADNTTVVVACFDPPALA